MTDKILTLLCPVLNEDEVIDIFLAAVQPHVDAAIALMGPDAKSEIIFIDDGSTDRTAALIAERAKAQNNIRLIRFSRNFGKEAALSAGLDYAAGDAVIPIDVDLQDPPAMIVQMVEAWIAGAQIVNARRVDRSSDSRLKRGTSRLFYHYYNKMVPRPIPSNVGDFRLLDRQVVDAMGRFGEHNRFMKSLFSWVGFDEVTIDYVRPARAAGTTKFRYWKLWNFALDGITASTTAPLRIWSYVGVSIAFLTMLFAVFIVIRTLIAGNGVPGYASLMVVILVIGSINFISIGVLGEYVGRISEEVRNRPLYIVRETVGMKMKNADREAF